MTVIVLGASTTRIFAKTYPSFQKKNRQRKIGVKKKGQSHLPLAEEKGGKGRTAKGKSDHSANRPTTGKPNPTKKKLRRTNW